MSSNSLDTVIVQNLTAQIAHLQAELDEIKNVYDVNNNAFFLCTMAMIVFLMQCGFAFLEAGAVRSKNTTNILIKNLLDSCITIIAYWAVGWAFAYGGSSDDGLWSRFIGTSQFFLIGATNVPKFFFQYVFAATSATIVSGAVAERCEFVTYISYCSMISAIVYPILTHWGWDPNGWMAVGFEVDDVHVKYVDFAGSGFVHLCGGAISLLAAYLMGPRIGRFDADGSKEKNNNDVSELSGHSVPFTALGGFILMFGFLAFNGGSMADIVEVGDGPTVAIAMVNTILSGAFAALTYLVIHYVTNGKWTLLLTINACITGMAAICGGCDQYEHWGAAIVGVGAALIYLAFSKAAVFCRIDDPLDAFAVHAGGGIWGLVAVPILGKNGIFFALGAGSGRTESGMTVSAAFASLGWQLVCAAAIVVWSVAVMLVVFLFLKKIGKFRVSTEVEVKGLDIYKHGEAAYPVNAYGHGWATNESTAASVDSLLRYKPFIVTGDLDLQKPEKKSSLHESPEIEWHNHGLLCARGDNVRVAVRPY